MLDAAAKKRTCETETRVRLADALAANSGSVPAAAPTPCKQLGKRHHAKLTSACRSRYRGMSVLWATGRCFANLTSAPRSPEARTLEKGVIYWRSQVPDLTLPHTPRPQWKKYDLTNCCAPRAVLLGCFGCSRFARVSTRRCCHAEDVAQEVFHLGPSTS